MQLHDVVQPRAITFETAHNATIQTLSTGCTQRQTVVFTHMHELTGPARLRHAAVHDTVQYPITGTSAFHTDE